MLCQYNRDCMRDATQIVSDIPMCDLHAIVKQRLLHSSSQKDKITIEFCCWIQDTDVFSVFTDHLNKGLTLDTLDVNKPRSKAKGVG